jgi:hypothetical protein
VGVGVGESVAVCGLVAVAPLLREGGSYASSLAKTCSSDAPAAATATAAALRYDDGLVAGRARARGERLPLAAAASHSCREITPSPSVSSSSNVGSAVATAGEGRLPLSPALGRRWLSAEVSRGSGERRGEETEELAGVAAVTAFSSCRRARREGGGDSLPMRSRSTLSSSDSSAPIPEADPGVVASLPLLRRPRLLKSPAAALTRLCQASCSASRRRVSLLLLLLLLLLLRL